MQLSDENASMSSSYDFRDAAAEMSGARRCGHNHESLKGTVSFLSLFFITVVALSIWAICFKPTPAQAVPSFSQQTGQPCSSCHVGAYGPQLTAFGRAFKLGGYADGNGEQHFPPLSLMLESSFTHTNASQHPEAAPGFGPNDNFATDQISLFYAGRIAPSFGAFIQTTYDGIGNVFTWDNTDVRYAHRGSLFGDDFTYGVTVNNNPTVQDLWNSTPAWGFPYAASGLAPSPAEASLLDGGLSQQVMGAGIYGMWNDLVYLEFTGYEQLARDTQSALGVGGVHGSDAFGGVIPYWRLALQHDFGDHYVEIGTLGLNARRYPGGDASAGADNITDTAVDANYQWTGDPDNLVSAHAILINENMNLGASRALSSTNPSDNLETFRTDLSYSYKNTYTPSVQYFRTWGSSDAALWGTANGSPNSQGFVAELAYVPFGKPDSFIPWFNGRLALQYVAYTEFDGTTAHASDNNTIYLNLWLSTDLFAGYSP